MTEVAARAVHAPPGLSLRHLGLRDFRNIERLDLDVLEAGFALVGDNGQGKTNLLEAIYYLHLLRSMRGARDRDVVRFGAAGFHVTGTAHGGGGARRELSVGFERAGGRKRVRVDGAEPARMSDALGAVPSVIVSPGDVQLVAGSPSARRRYVDIALALTSRPYLAALQAYRATLARRNAALRDVARGGHGDARVAVWEPALATHGAVLLRARHAWMETAAPEFARLCAVIGERGDARMRYVSALPPSVDAEPALLAALEQARGNDVRRGVTSSGPHRDDIELTLDGRELRTYGSAGQHRTAAIALRMLEAATLRDRFGAPPLFLLDDPFAELDARRSQLILELLAGAGLGQTVLAVPRARDIPRELTTLDRWRVERGELTRAAT